MSSELIRIRDGYGERRVKELGSDGLYTVCCESELDMKRWAGSKAYLRCRDELIKWIGESK